MITKTKEKNQEWLDGLLTGLLMGRSLSRADSRKFFTFLFTGQLPFSKAKAFLLLLSQKGETSDELLGCLQALQKLEKPIGPKIAGLMDTCGTGGDGSRTINISTLAAIVMAGAGAKIAKHGNRAISSRSGSSDLMESFGIRLDAGLSKATRSIDRCGFGYLHAPFFHPVFAQMQPLRQSLRRRTILNFLGPLVNPMRLDHQLVGVSSKRLLPLYARVLSRLPRKTALVCHSFDGMDEISTAAPTTVVWITPHRLREEVVRPEAYGLQKASLRDLAVRSVGESKIRAHSILTARDTGPARDIVVLNAAFGLVVCRKAKTVHEGIRLAQRSLDSGRALQVLNQLRMMSN